MWITENAADFFVTNEVRILGDNVESSLYWLVIRTSLRFRGVSTGLTDCDLMLSLSFDSWYQFVISIKCRWADFCSVLSWNDFMQSDKYCVHAASHHDVNFTMLDNNLQTLWFHVLSPWNLFALNQATERESSPKPESNTVVSSSLLMGSC